MPTSLGGQLTVALSGLLGVAIAPWALRGRRIKIEDYGSRAGIQSWRSVGARGSPRTAGRRPPRGLGFRGACPRKRSTTRRVRRVLRRRRGRELRVRVTRAGVVGESAWALRRDGRVAANRGREPTRRRDSSWWPGHESVPRSSSKPSQRPARGGRRHPELAPDRPPTLAVFPQGKRDIVGELASRRIGTTPVSARRGNADVDSGEQRSSKSPVSSNARSRLAPAPRERVRRPRGFRDPRGREGVECGDVPPR